jgi:hypothetical protein
MKATREWLNNNIKDKHYVNYRDTPKVNGVSLLNIIFRLYLPIPLRLLPDPHWVW